MVAVRSRLSVRRRRFRDIWAATQDGREDHGGHRGAERFAGMVVHRQIVSRAKVQRPLNLPTRFGSKVSYPLLAIASLSAVQGGAPFGRWLAQDPPLQHPEVGPAVMLRSGRDIARS